MERLTKTIISDGVVYAVCVNYNTTKCKHYPNRQCESCEMNCQRLARLHMIEKELFGEEVEEGKI